MRFSFRALVVFLLFVASFSLLLRTGSSGDLVVRILIWAFIAAMSVVAITLTILRGGAYGQEAVVPKALRRWLLGESRKDEGDRRE
jgi:hypothetical protein